MSAYQTTSSSEVAGGARLGGKFVGPLLGTNRVWDGRPPVIGDEASPRVLSLSAQPTVPSATLTAEILDVKIEAIFSNGFGDQVRRVFDLGVGVTTTLNAGAFELCRIVTVNGIPDGLSLYFSWNFENPGSRSDERLLLFQDYPVLNTRIPIPEGTVAIVTESAGTVSFYYPRLAATFDVALVAGQTVPCLGGTLSFDAATQFIFIMTTP